MPTRHRGRVINKFTRQPVANAVLGLRLRQGSSWPSGYTTIAVDADGEFDHSVNILPGISNQDCELTIDRDKGFRYKTQRFTINPSDPTKDLGDIELEPYTVVSPDA